MCSVNTPLTHSCSTPTPYPERLCPFIHLKINLIGVEVVASPSLLRYFIFSFLPVLSFLLQIKANFHSSILSFPLSHCVLRLAQTPPITVIFTISQYLPTLLSLSMHSSHTFHLHPIDSLLRSDWLGWVVVTRVGYRVDLRWVR